MDSYVAKGAVWARPAVLDTLAPRGGLGSNRHILLASSDRSGGGFQRQSDSPHAWDLPRRADCMPVARKRVRESPTASCDAVSMHFDVAAARPGSPAEPTSAGPSAPGNVSAEAPRSGQERDESTKTKDFCKVRSLTQSGWRQQHCWWRATVNDPSTLARCGSTVKARALPAVLHAVGSAAVRLMQATV